MIKPGIYKHYKGNIYKVHFTAMHSETLEKMVVYECLYKNEAGKFWVRPLKMFIEEIEINNTRVKRFEFISNE